MELTEQEQRLIEQLRILREQDPVFGHYPQVLIDRLNIFIERGKRYNGKHSGVYRQNFKLGDTTALILMDRKLERGVTLCMTHNGVVPDDDGNELVYDATNQGDLWGCCRYERKLKGAR